MNSDLSDNIWWTRKSRIQTEKRLLFGAMHSQVLLLWYSLFSVGASVYYLKFDPDSDYSGIAWVLFSVLVLVISTLINGLGIKERAALVKDCYEALKGLCDRCKTEEESVIAEDYERILKVCENHTDIDYYRAWCELCLTREEGSVSPKPTRYVWFHYSFSYVKRYLTLSVLYLLPVVVFYYLEAA